MFARRPPSLLLHAIYLIPQTLVRSVWSSLPDGETENCQYGAELGFQLQSSLLKGSCRYSRTAWKEVSF